MFRLHKQIVFACAVALFGATASAQTTVDIPTARKLTSELLVRGQPAAAREIVLKLLTRSPNDPELLINLSRADRSLGNQDSSIHAGRKAFRHADSQLLKFLAARTTAQALSSAGHRTRAQIWLRRAGALAPNAQAEAIVRSEYRHVRARNPLSFSLAATAAPSNNINDAPKTNRLVLGPFVGINPTALPISGVESTLSASATLRFPPTEKTTQSVTLSYFGRRVRLGSEAAEINPDLSNADFRFDRIQLGWSGRFRQSADSGIFDLGIQVFNDESGGEHFQNGVAGQLGYTFRIKERQSLRIGTAIDLLDRTDLPNRSSQTLRLQADWSVILRNNDRLAVQAVLADTGSDSASVAHDAKSIRLTYAFGKPVRSTFFAVSSELRSAEFDDTAFSFLDIREDDRLTISASATFTALDIYGFAPVLELRHERNRSNITSFDSESTQIGFSLRSTY